MQLAISQILCTPPTDCLSTRKLTYKPGLWHVRGEVLAAHLRVDAHVALRFVPSAQDLCDCVISLVRSAQFSPMPMVAIPTLTQSGLASSFREPP